MAEKPEDLQPLPDDGLAPPPPPEGFVDGLKWKLRELYRLLFPLTEADIAAGVQRWRQELNPPEFLPDAGGSDRCCVINIPGVGIRCSSAPSNDVECRRLAHDIDPRATAIFHGDRPCIGCHPLP